MVRSLSALLAAASGLLLLGHVREEAEHRRKVTYGLYALMCFAWATYTALYLMSF